MGEHGQEEERISRCWNAEQRKATLHKASAYNTLLSKFDVTGAKHVKTRRRLPEPLVVA